MRISILYIIFTLSVFLYSYLVSAYPVLQPTFSGLFE